MAEAKSQPKTTTTYITAVGRRKTASARVKLMLKNADMIVNDMPIGQYFSGATQRIKYLKPFELTQTVGKFGFLVKVEGSGKSAQLDAVVHGISRALSTLNEEKYRPILKKAGLLTRDSRMKESKKVGTGGKARRKKQSPKR